MTVLAPLGLLAVPGSSPGFVALVRALGAWCRPRAAEPGDEPPVAWLASSPTCPGLSDLAEPLAVWVDDRRALEQAAELRPTPRVLVTSDLAGPSVLFPQPGLDLRGFLPFPPLIRRRWRSHLGLPATLIVTALGDGPAALPDDLLPTAMALASVVVATGPRLAEALAWAAPCVTDAASAGAIGAGQADVVVGAAPALERLAVEVAADDGRAAALSGAGRWLAERRLDQHRPARHVAEALGLVRPVEHVATRSTERVLDALSTPATSPFRPRVAALLAARP
ncbi:MAG: hypothetical protein ACR2KK_15025 [Acidimicrobiales bacterium]